jgi:hypothetical protein
MKIGLGAALSRSHSGIISGLVYSAGQGKARCCRSVNTGFLTTPIDANSQNEIDSQN